ncbi:MAG: hypothetical protein AAFR77_00345, partial [Cyanobacteria bacterium J06631_2]
MNDIERSNQNTKINLRNQKFIIFAEDLYDLTPNEILSVFQNVSKKSLAELRLFDLALFNEEPLTSAGGVYLFFSLDNACLYVGKATSRSFISRIPAHFDPRSDSWFATFPNKVLKMKLAKDYASALIFCRDCSVLLVKFNSDRDCKSYAGIMETYLRDILRPKLNPL